MSVDIFLNLPGIPGDAAARGHEGWIEVSSVGWGVSQSATDGGSFGGGAAARGKVSQRDVVLTAPLSIATPLIFETIAKGTHVQRATLEAVRAGESPSVVTRWEFEDILLTLLDVAGAEPGFSDSFGLMAGKVRITVFEQDPKGGAGKSVSRGWDFRTNRAW